jgi:hypothetical protein
MNTLCVLTKPQRIERTNLLTPSPRFGEEFEYDVVIGDLLGNSRILDKFLLDGDANTVFREENLELFVRLKIKIRTVTYKFIKFFFMCVGNQQIYLHPILLYYN